MMKLNLLLLLCLNGLVPVAWSIPRTIPHHYKLIMTSNSWSDAQNYCRAKYTDLAAIQSNTDWLRLKKEPGLVKYTSWVGLYNDINGWRWSLSNLPLKNVTYTNWYPGEPNNFYGQESCVAMGSDNHWWDAPCSQLRPVICYNAKFSGTARFVGIGNPWMTWPQAQAYCRTYHTDLVSSLSSSDNNLIMQVRNTVGDAWIGLYRDTWKWVDGTIASNIPWGSGEPNNYGGNENCGVVNNGLYGDRPCSNPFYFFCDTNFPTRSQTVRLQVMTDGSVFDPAVQSSILEKMKQKLEENGMLENTKLAWKVQPNRNIFNKKKKDHL